MTSGPNGSPAIISRRSLQSEPPALKEVALHPVTLNDMRSNSVGLKKHWVKGVSAGDGEAAVAIGDLVEMVTVFRDPGRRGGRHTILFRLFEHLAPDDSLQIVVDHDPRRLRLQLEARHGSRCGWTYLQAGPDIWRVRLRLLDRGSEDHG